MDENMNVLAGTVQELLINLEGRIDDISIRYKESGIFDGERIANLMDDLDALAEGISVIRSFYSRIDTTELKDKLSQMDEALERKDYPLFNDLMQYELKDLLVYWKEILIN